MATDIIPAQASADQLMQWVEDNATENAYLFGLRTGDVENAVYTIFLAYFWGTKPRSKRTATGTTRALWARRWFCEREGVPDTTAIIQHYEQSPELCFGVALESPQDATLFKLTFGGR